MKLVGECVFICTIEIFDIVLRVQFIHRLTVFLVFNIFTECSLHRSPVRCIWPLNVLSYAACGGCLTFIDHDKQYTNRTEVLSYLYCLQTRS
jgi:hypothetical protein